ncbi:hypothetical protein [Streptomyces sp. PTD9-10]|uniref:hypothetical protein n=1 Tax=Streptomyces sp. PTD9-10 TaxID=3120151 RepID=UPI00300AF3C0
MSRSPSLAPSSVHPAPATAARPALVEDVLSTKDRIRVAGFFPGLKAAVASGSLSVFDGVKIAQVFTPLMLQAAGAQSTDESFARSVASYLDESVRHKPLVGEPYHVVAVKAQNPDALAVVLDGRRAAFPLTDVEPHKTYAPTQANLYVRSGAKPEFDAFAASFTDATTWELKEPSVNDQGGGSGIEGRHAKIISTYRDTSIHRGGGSMEVEGHGVLHRRLLVHRV